MKKNGIINNFSFFLHKTDNKTNLTDLEINFYEIDSLNGKPSKRLNKYPIIYSAKNKSRKEVNINVLNQK